MTRNQIAVVGATVVHWYKEILGGNTTSGESEHVRQFFSDAVSFYSSCLAPSLSLFIFTLQSRPSLLLFCSLLLLFTLCFHSSVLYSSVYPLPSLCTLCSRSSIRFSTLLHFIFVFTLLTHLFPLLVFIIASQLAHPAVHCVFLLLS